MRASEGLLQRLARKWGFANVDMDTAERIAELIEPVAFERAERIALSWLQER